jgi:hypothetical protein
VGTRHHPHSGRVHDFFFFNLFLKVWHWKRTQNNQKKNISRKKVMDMDTGEEVKEVPPRQYAPMNVFTKNDLAKMATHVGLLNMREARQNTPQATYQNVGASCPCRHHQTGPAKHD